MRGKLAAAICEYSRLMSRVPILPTLFVLGAVAVMIGLGFWQLDRLKQKEAMIARYEAARSDLGPSHLWPDDPSAAYRKVNVYCGRAREWTSIAGRNARGESGWAHVARCTIGGMRPGAAPDMRMPDYVLKPADVVIGWSQSPQPVRWNGGEVIGTVTPGGKLGFRIIADPPLAGLEANAKPDPRDIPNNHLGYAVQWFFFAVTALVIYVLALRKRLAGTGAPR